jgi:hypothetical protein
MSDRRPCPHAEDAVGWAMQALEPEVEATMAKHLPYCHVCRQVVSHTEEVMDALASTAQQVEPRPEVRERLMASLVSTPQTPPSQREPPWPAIGPPEVATTEASSTPPGWRPWGLAGRSRGAGPGVRTTMSSRQRRWRRAAVLVATALIGVIGVGGVVVHEFTSTPAQEQAQARTEQLRHELAQAETPGSQHILLRVPNGMAVAAVVLADGQRKVITAGLPPNQRGASTYVLWGLGGEKPTALGTFDVAGTETGPRPVGPVQPDQTFTGYAISIEKGTVAPQLPSVVVASGQLPA